MVVARALFPLDAKPCGNVVNFVAINIKVVQNISHHLRRFYTRDEKLGQIDFFLTALPSFAIPFDQNLVKFSAKRQPVARRHGVTRQGASDPSAQLIEGNSETN